MMTEFQQKVYGIVKRIPKGKVLTYKQVAQKLGDKNLARAVGNALNKNHDSKIPCYRVVRSDGKIGGFNKGVKRKVNLLREEGLRIKNSRLI
jgi:O-6-methylguanine DNA methyltransferase